MTEQNEFLSYVIAPKNDESEVNRLQTELGKAREELSKLTRIREDGERELEDLTASLFQVCYIVIA